MKKYILSAFVAFFSMLAFAQNVEFKAANFKDDKEGLKKAEEAQQELLTRPDPQPSEPAQSP